MVFASRSPKRQSPGHAAFRAAGLTLSFEAAIDEATRVLQGIAPQGPAQAGEPFGGPGR